MGAIRDDRPENAEVCFAIASLSLEAAAEMIPILTAADGQGPRTRA